MLVGMATQNGNGSDWPTNMGPMTARRSYNKTADFSATHGVPTSFAASNAHVDSGLNVVTIYSFKPDIILMAGTSLDASVEGFLDSFPEGQKAILTVWHEPDGKVRQGQFTIAQWQAAFTHFCDLVHAHGNPNIKTAAIFEAYQQSNPGTQYADMWPGDGYADYILYDGYTDLGSGDSVWKKGYDFAQSKGLPWGVGEVGFRSGTVTNTWDVDQALWAYRHDAAVFCWFNCDAGGVVPTPGTGTAAVAGAYTLAQVYYTDPDDFEI